MWFKIKIWFQNPRNILWLTPTLGAVIGVLISLVAYFLDRYYAHIDLPEVDSELINGLLSVISSSMLAVSTFSLSTMVSAYSSASSNVTPRATKLVMADDNSRVAIASFIAAFIFSLISQLTLGLEMLGNTGRFVLLISTVLMLVYVVFSLIRWIGVLSHLGRLGNTIGKLNDKAKNSVVQWRLSPNKGAHVSEEVWEDGIAICAKNCHYITHIDVEGLQAWAEKQNAQVQVCALVGVLLSPDVVLMKVRGVDKLSEEDCDFIRNCFVYSLERWYDEDPRYGMIVLSEVALRSLSVGVNDPGTTILVFNNMLEILVDAQPTKEQREKQKKCADLVYDRLYLMHFDAKDLIEQPFEPIVNLSADDMILVVRLLKVLHKIYINAPETALRNEAKVQATALIERATHKLGFESDIKEVQDLYAKLFESV